MKACECTGNLCQCPQKHTGPDGTEFYAIPVEEIAPLAEEYIRILETSKTTEFCTCEWAVHPDDTGKPEGERRLRLLAHAELCPVHTQEGRILGFFGWVFRDRD